MIGSNSLILNTATMMQAVQEWLDKRMPEGAPKVTDIYPKDQSRGTFEVRVKEQDATE